MAIIWYQDSSDYSWFATDRDGYFYRVNKVFVPDPHYKHNTHAVWVTAWSECFGSSKLRIGSYGYKTVEEAKAAMENIMPCEDEVAA